MEVKRIIEKLTKLKETMPDLIIKKMDFGIFKSVYIITISTISSSDRINDYILKYFGNKSTSKNSNINISKEISDFVPAINKKDIKDFDELLYYLFNGFTVIIHNKTYLCFETKANIDRGVTEPTSEPVTKGPKDSFNENYNTNIGLIRKRIKSKYLIIKEIIVGKESKTKVAVIYMENICDTSVAEEIIEDIKNIDIDGITDISNIKELIDLKNHTLFPTIINSEKPDDTSRVLLDGKIIITMENSPNILFLPTFFIDFFQNGEDYYGKTFFISFVRIIRIISYFTSILLPGLFLALITYNQEIIPTSLLINFASQRNNVPFPALVEITILFIIFEIIYEGDARTPYSRGTSLSILGALVLGESAVNAGLISQIMLIVVAISSMSSLIIVFQDMQSSIRFWRYLTMLFVTLFGIVGFYISCTLLTINLCTIESYGKPYLLPFAPFDLKSQSDALIRKSINNIKYRKPYLSLKNLIRKN